MDSVLLEFPYRKTRAAIMLMLDGELFRQNLEAVKKMLKDLPIPVIQERAILVVRIAVILGTAIALFGQDLSLVFNDAFRSETTSYLLAVPFIFAFVIYRKRKMLRVTISLKLSEAQSQKRLLLILGILLSGSAILLYWFGSSTFTPIQYHLFALPLFVSGLVLILFNPQTLRQLAFPIFLLIFFVPPPGEILSDLGATLSVVSASASNAIMNTLSVPSSLSIEFGSPVITITSSSGMPMSFPVDVACSGIYSLIGFLLFALFVVYITRDKPLKRMTLLLIGFPLVYLLNIIRISSILLIGYQFGETLALDVFHLVGGWVLIFIGTLFLLFVSERLLKIRIFPRSNEKCQACTSQLSSEEDSCPKCGRIVHVTKPKLSKGDIVKMAAIIISVILLMSIQAPVFALTRDLAVDINTPLGQPISTKILPTIPGYNFTYQQPAPEKFLTRSQEDLATSFLFTGSSKEPLWITVEISSTLSNLHTWENCLITYPISHGLQITIRGIDQIDVSLYDNPPIVGRIFAFQYLSTNETRVVLSWFERATFRVNSTSEQKYIKITVQADPMSSQNLKPLEGEMVTVAKTVVAYWQPIKTWSQVGLVLSQNGDRLVTIASILLAGIVVLLMFDRRRQGKENFYAYEKISDSNKQFINIVRRAEGSMSNLLHITSSYEETFGESISEPDLLNELQRAEESGLIERSVGSRNDEPIRTWRVRIVFPKGI